MATLGNKAIRSGEAGIKLRQMFLRLKAPTNSATKAMGEGFFRQVDKARKAGASFASILHFTSKTLDTFTDPLEKSRARLTLFGKRNVAAFETLEKAIGKSGEGLDEFLAKSKQVFSGDIDIVSQLANKRLESFGARLAILREAIKALQIRTLLNFLNQTFGSVLDEVSRAIGDVTKALSIIQTPIDATEELLEDNEKLGKGLSATIKAIASGIDLGMKIIKTAFNTLVDIIKFIGSSVSEALGPKIIKAITAFITVLAVSSVVLVPLLGLLTSFLAIGAALVGTVASVIVSIAAIPTMLSVISAILPVLIPLLGLAALSIGAMGIAALLLVGILKGLKKEGESLLDVFIRIATDFIGGFIVGFERAIDTISAAWLVLKDSFSGLMDNLKRLGNAFGNTSNDMVSTGDMLGSSLGTIFDSIVSTVIIATAGMVESLSLMILIIAELTESWNKFLESVETLKTLGLEALLLKNFILPIVNSIDRLTQILDKVAPDFLTKGIRQDFQELKASVNARAARLGIGPDGEEITRKSPAEILSDKQGAAASEGAKLAEKLREGLQDIRKAVKDMKFDFTLDNRTNVDGDCLARARARFELDLTKRAGAKTTPFVRKKLTAGKL